MTETVEQFEQRIREEERTATAERIASAIARRVCTDICVDPTCSTLRFAARIARQQAAPLRVPTQPGPRS